MMDFHLSSLIGTKRESDDSAFIKTPLLHLKEVCVGTSTGFAVALSAEGQSSPITLSAYCDTPAQ